jgi:hypothetical protein
MRETERTHYRSQYGPPVVVVNPKRFWLSCGIVGGFDVKVAIGPKPKSDYGVVASVTVSNGGPITYGSTTDDPAVLREAARRLLSAARLLERERG